MDLSSVWPGIQKVCETEKTEFWVLPVKDGYVSLALWKASKEVQLVHHGMSEVVLMKFKRMSIDRLQKLLRRMLVSENQRRHE